MTHIGILLCDEHYPEAIKKFGSYEHDFKKMFSEDDPMAWRFSVWRCHEGELPDSVKLCDAWIISGSKQGAYDPEPWISNLKSFISSLNDSNAKTVGVCFGHQIIHEALGGKVEKSEKGWGLGAYSITTYDTLGNIASGQTLKLLAIHQDQVQEMAKGFTLVGGCPFTPFAITKKNTYILTFQSHPEFEHNFYKWLCVKIKNKIGNDAFQTAKASFDIPDDRHAVRAVIRNFLTNTSYK